MAFLQSGIGSMMQSIIESGVAYGNRYEVLILPPPILRSGVSPQSLSIRCSNATIPNKTLGTQSNRLYGPARNFPFEISYAGETNLSFLLSADLRERQFFDSWIDSISDPSSYKVEFYDNYVTEVQIITLGKDDSPSHILYLEEAYPKAIGEIQLGFDKDGDIMQQEVTFAYRKFRSSYSTYAPLVGPVT